MAQKIEEYYDETYYGKDDRGKGMAGKHIFYELPFIQKWIKKTNAKTVLDIGCGKGHLTNAIQEMGCSVVGVDFSKVILQKARELYPRCSFVQWNVSEKMMDQKFDFIFSTQVIEHIFDIDVFLHNIHASLNTGGVLLLTTPNILSPKNRIKILFGRDDIFRDLAHIRFFSPQHLKEIIENGKFTVEELAGLGTLSSLSVNLSGNILIAARKN